MASVAGCRASGERAGAPPPIKIVRMIINDLKSLGRLKLLGLAAAKAGGRRRPAAGGARRPAARVHRGCPVRACRFFERTSVFSGGVCTSVSSAGPLARHTHSTGWPVECACALPYQIHSRPTEQPARRSGASRRRRAG